MTEYTGPAAPSKLEWDIWYNRMKDFINPIHQRGFAISCHPDDKAMMQDMLEQLSEDDTWAHDDVPPLVVSALMKAGQVQPVDPDTLKELKMSQVVGSKKGFGRFGGLLLPSHGGLNNPWVISAEARRSMRTPEAD